jgi:ribose transport system substrate-binding protein
MSALAFSGSLLLSPTVSVAQSPAAPSSDTVVLLPDTNPAPGNNPQTKPGEFAKKGPWKIGMSHYGLAGSTHTYQTAHEAEYEVSKHPEINQYLFRSADLSAAKQAADIEDLIAQKVDVLIVAPLTPSSASAGIKKARAAGIPVIVYLGKVNTDDYTTDIQGDDYFFGKVMAEYLIKKLNGKGNVWMLRGVPGHPIDDDRHRGAMDAFKAAPGIKVVADQYANWLYDDSKKVCESLYLSNPKVDGIWTDGANMSMGCEDVFKQFGTKVPPITGEANNGWLRRWKDDKLSSIAPICPPGLSAAAVKAAVALLEGKPLYHHYVNRPEPITDATLTKYFRPDLSDGFWLPTALPEAKLHQYYALK